MTVAPPVSPSTTRGVRLSPRLAAVLAEELGELPGAEPWRGEVQRRAAAFQTALRGGELGAILDRAANLVGLGEGSTPAGDDYLVGVLHALATNSGLRAEASLLTAVARTGDGRTTSASAAWLAAAARGEASPVWRRLLDALASGDEPSARHAARVVCATGHTSGAFSLRGFLDTLGA